MGIHLYTDEANRTAVVMADIVGCTCTAEGDHPFLRVIDDQGNRVSLQLPAGLARALHSTWVRSALTDADGGEGI